MALIGVALCVLVISYLYWKGWRIYRRSTQLSKNIPRIYTLPFPILNTFGFKMDPEGFFHQTAWSSCAQQSCKAIRIYVGPHVALIVGGVREAEKILNNTKEINKSYDYSLMRPWLGLGLLTSTGKPWRQRRKLLTPAFHYDILKDFIPIFNEQAKILVHRLEDTNGQPVNAYPFITLCALDIICETAMGRNIRAQEKDDSPYVQAIYKLNEILHQRQKSPWFWPDVTFYAFGRGFEQRRCLQAIKGFTGKVIEERAEDHVRSKAGSEDANNNIIPIVKGKNGEKERLAFLDMLLNMKANGQIDRKGIQDEVDTFMFEGHDTTSAGMCWALQCLACYPETLKKVHEELDAVFGDDHRDVTQEDLTRLEYLECCIKESLRLFPSVSMYGRELTSDTKMEDDTILAGSRIIINAYAIHRDPDFWPDPYHFNPERFTRENSAGRHPFAFVPFSAGSRNCIGQRFVIMEEKTVLAWILRYFTVVATARLDQLTVVSELILRPVNGINMIFKLRKPLPRNRLDSV